MEQDKFGEYVVTWFHNYIEEHEEDDDLLQTLFNTICPREEGDSLSDWLDENETVCDYLLAQDAEIIFDRLFTNGGNDMFEDMPDAESFIEQMFKDAAKELDYDEYEFTDEFIEDMAAHCIEYDTPLPFFNDLQYGGCASGMIGMVIYNSDCLKLYGKYANDMEEFREDFEEEIGERIKRERNIPHYVWTCWFTYEELAFQIARYLFENNF